MEAESLAAACLGSLFCQRIVGAVGSWWEVGEQQEEANRRWAPTCFLGMLGGMCGSQECWWVWGHVAGLWNDDVDGCDSLPNEAEARLSGPSGPASTECLLRLSGKMMSMRVTACTESCQPAGSGTAPRTATETVHSPPTQDPFSPLSPVKPAQPL